MGVTGERAVKGPGVFASAEGRRLGRPRVGVLGRTVVTTGFFAERGALVFTLEIFTTVLATLRSVFSSTLRTSRCSTSGESTKYWQ